MILQALNDLYSRLASDPDYEIAPPGFSPQKISFRVVLEPDGELFAIEDARTPNEKGKLMSTVMQVPDCGKRTSGVKANFLWDSGVYVLGRRAEGKSEAYAKERHEAFVDKHLELRSVVTSPPFQALCSFLERWDPDRCSEYPLLNEVGSGFGVFQIQGERVYLHDNPYILEWWTQNLPTNGNAVIGQCLVSGNETRIARLHPSINGIAGAKSTGASLVSFNARAYDSYGKEQSNNSPVSENAAFQYGTALNSLLTGPKSSKHRLRICDTTTVFWTEKPTAVENVFVEIIGRGSQAIEEAQSETERSTIERLLKAIRDGSAFQDFGDELATPFFILGLAPNAARLSIRFFYRSTIHDLIEKLHAHHESMQIVREFPEPKGNRSADPEFPAIWQILRETARVSDEIPPLLGGALARSIVQGVPYPEALLSAVMRRIRADRRVPYLRSATIKAVLTRNHRIQIPTMLDPTNKDTAYRLGRLFAALEKTQEDALGPVNAGIRDRFYGSASATPASVFPRLLRTYQHHLNKINVGQKIHRERLIQDILEPVQRFPSQLNLQKQGLFAIGYYHQRKDLFTKRQTENAQLTESEI